MIIVLKRFVVLTFDETEVLGEALRAHDHDDVTSIREYRQMRLTYLGYSLLENCGLLSPHHTENRILMPWFAICQFP